MHALIEGLPFVALAAVLALAGTTDARAAGAEPLLEPCRLRGVEHEAQCGRVRRPLDPARAHGAQIDVHFAVLPALARNKKPDPVIFFAGGPGQSAIALAGAVERMTARLGNRRDVVLIDQRGTGRSAPLACDEDATAPSMREMADSQHQLAELERCRAKLQQLPHGDLRQYTTTIAMADVEAVRRALKAPRVNLVGGSYGTRAALEYLRQFPHAVRRVVIDGVAPPDMVLPASFSPDNQAAWDALLAACEKDATCAARHPRLRAQWAALLASLPREVVAPHPVTGRPEAFTLTREIATGLVRAPLYAPALAAALPHAITEAAQGRFVALVGLASAMGGGRDSPMRLATGMHFSVVCAEDVPRLDRSPDRPSADFGASFADLYRKACAGWPRGVVPEAFYAIPSSPAPVLVLSGGADPATPPRHGERVAKALGGKARHVVVPQAGHGVLSVGCMRDVVFRFVDADSDAEALQVDATCAQAVPRPPAFTPPDPAASAAGTGAAR
jgi:pimeloyl-ACP methyl ester carboxylesterase